MSRCVRSLAVAWWLTLIALPGCGLWPTGPSESVGGEWMARSTGHFYFVGLSLQQRDDTITGRACAASDGVLLFKDAPVQGEHPHVQFTVTLQATQPCCPHLAGRRFSGKLDGTGDIVGSYDGVDVRFQRMAAPVCGG